MNCIHVEFEVPGNNFFVGRERKRLGKKHA